VLVIPDLQKLVLTSRQTTLWIYDLKDPSAAPVTMTGLPAGQDELDLRSDSSEDLCSEHDCTLLRDRCRFSGTDSEHSGRDDSAAGRPEQPRYNPVDGFIYQTVPSTGVVVI